MSRLDRNQLNNTQRAEDIQAVANEEFDVVVIGGGVTGAGVALDAASRGLRTLIVEAQDWASGTSSRSSRLVHGGLRYLYQLDFKLVAEALHERGLLLTSLAPHLVKAQPFLWPLKTRLIERAYSAVGVGLYDTLGVSVGKHAVPVQKHHSKAGAMKRFPGVKENSLIGAIEFYDARVDDARLVITLVRTALQYGARALSRTQVVAVDQQAGGQVTGVVLKDLETGQEIKVKTSGVVHATGVWTQASAKLAEGNPGLKVLASKGIHLLFDKDKIDSSTGVFLRTEKSVLFIIPWQNYWVIGTTDTAWHEQLKHPVPTSADIDYVLQQANQVLAKPLTREDIRGTYAGLRPLLQPTSREDAKTTKVSREHSVARLAPGMVAIAGGKLTTYRVMAKDAIDYLLGKEGAAARPSITEDTPLIGADGYQAMVNQRADIAKQYGWSEDMVDHLLHRYGSELPKLLKLIDLDESLARPLAATNEYLRVEVAWACQAEGAMHLEDIFIQRVRLNSEQRDRGRAAVDEASEIAAAILGWDAERLDEEKKNYLARIEAELAAEEQDNDAAASKARLAAADIRPAELLH